MLRLEPELRSTKSIVLCGRLWLKRVATPKATSTHAQNNALEVSPDFRFQPSSIPQHGQGSHPVRGIDQPDRVFDRIGLAEQVQKAMPFQLRSPNAIPPAHTLMAFFFSVVVGARRFAHTDWLRSDKALHAMLGISRFPGIDTIRNLSARFSQGRIQAFWRPLWIWILSMFSAPPDGFSLDLDPTITMGHSNFAEVGSHYQCRRRGRGVLTPIFIPTSEFGLSCVQPRLASGAMPFRSST